MRIPNHIGIIPDGNRRWAVSNGLGKEKGYEPGLEPGLAVFKLCEKLGIKEMTFYGFTVDNTKRPTIQRLEFTKACINAVKILAKENATLLVIGNADSPMFPSELLPYTKRQVFGNGGVKVNFLVNYGWEWDLSSLNRTATDKLGKSNNRHDFPIKSHDISRVDLIIRWGGRRRLSGFLPIQSVYADFYVLDEYWPDFKEEQFYRAIEWYQTQDVTLGG